MPGVTLNIGKRGVSTSVGVRGAHITAGRGRRATVGIPGTGLSYTTRHGSGGTASPASSRGVQPHGAAIPRIGLVGWLVVIGVLALAVAALSFVAPVVMPVGAAFALLVLINPGGLGDRVHAWRVWRALPGLHGRQTALGFSSVLALELVVVPLAAFALVHSGPAGAAPSSQFAAAPAVNPANGSAPNLVLPSETSSPSPTDSTPTPSSQPTPSPTAVVAAPTPDPLAGVTAICNDGTYSYSGKRSGSCSRHGGVQRWVNEPPA